MHYALITLLRVVENPTPDFAMLLLLCAAFPRKFVRAMHRSRQRVNNESARVCERVFCVQTLTSFRVLTRSVLPRMNAESLAASAVTRYWQVNQ